MEEKNQWIDANALSLFVVVAAIICLWAFLTGRVGPELLGPLGIYLMAGGIVWVVAAIIGFRMGDMVSGTANGFFGIILGFGVGASMLTQALFPGAIPGTLDGWWLFAGGLAAIPIAVAAGRNVIILGVALFNLGIYLILIGLVMAGVISLSLPGLGWQILASGILYLYIATAILINTTFRRPIVPIR